MMTGAASFHDFVPSIETVGEEVWNLAAELYPICRSITGPGVRETLGLISRHISLDIHEIPTGTQVLDWVVPPEWSLRAAHIADHSGRRIVDLADHTLHVVSYSTPVSRRMTMSELRPHLYSLPDQPDLIPYRTAYYRPDWGFCLTHRMLETMRDETYEVVIDSTLGPGSLTYGEALIRGQSDEEVLLSAHICHPSLANDNCSGLAVLAWLGKLIAQARTRYSYRLLFAPGTIGAITWLASNRGGINRIKHGLVLSNLGDGGGPTYKRSRCGNALIDRAAEILFKDIGPTARLEDFSPYGYDERQYCSPGFDLAVGALSRSAWGKFREYHTSADNLDFIRPVHLGRSVELVCRLLDVLESDRLLVGTMPYGEPQLGRRGLYDDERGRPVSEAARMAMLWVLNLADGRHTLVDAAKRSGIEFHTLCAAADKLEAAGLLTRP